MVDNVVVHGQEKGAVDKEGNIISYHTIYFRLREFIQDTIINPYYWTVYVCRNVISKLLYNASDRSKFNAACLSLAPC